MYLRRLALTTFKSYEDSSMEFSPGINCFVGNNGVGKTNILDAIHYLSMTRSFFSTVESMSIKHDSEFFIIQGVFHIEDREDTIICSYRKQKQKSLRRNGKDYDRFSDHIGLYPAVMVSPADNVLITGGSEERRRFLNMIISQYDHEYLDALMSYNKALQSRNRLLKEYASAGSFDEDMILSLNYQLNRFGARIYSARRDLIEKIEPLFRDYYKTISLSREEVILQYRSQLNTGSLTSLLADNIERDRHLQYTTCGIHKDDLDFLTAGGHAVRQQGSQGQQKTFLLALKLAKYSYIEKMSGIKPMLLLDDVFDKFDADRVSQIITLMGDSGFGQIFITDTHHSRLKMILEETSAEYKLFKVGSNGVEEITGNGIEQ